MPGTITQEQLETVLKMDRKIVKQAEIINNLALSLKEYKDAHYHGTIATLGMAMRANDALRSAGKEI